MDMIAVVGNYFRYFHFSVCWYVNVYEMKILNLLKILKQHVIKYYENE